jgi:glucosamine--fructose-6-phosphate aminotransferase (isomerizing)
LFQIIKGLNHLDEQIREVLKLDEQVKDLAQHLFKQKSLLIMGRGYNYATCMEGALVSRMLIVQQ